jgi:hypothetical protein
MSFGGNIAASYLASFRPLEPVEGFENVKSTLGTDLLGGIPAQNAALKSQLASLALKELGAQALAEQNQEFIAAQNDLTRRDQRRAGALRMAGELIAQAMPSSSAGADPGDPLGLLTKIIGFRGTQANKRAQDMIRSNSFLQEALKGIS